ncbi:type II toxin-antitoxin system VapC family toxin [Parabacteroides goldsteinii]|uniref:type II toxin-antitoxin system VapC family toxin n=1 Tax=Parabacteroides goldsteinii TaxID=328812 RepID=UPI000E98C552|nr:type II toxin-antitoxin system VapC family toxin [Parabacteroides goldsteinii]HBA31614.1 VapC toxin family PIN domain ribonuclease [Parabacteroides goldsteinii]
MKKYLLDTNICIFLLRGKYNVDKKIDTVGLDNCFISEITVAELKYGAELGRQNSLQHRIQNLDSFIKSINVLPITDAIDMFATEKARLRIAGTPMDDNFDLLIGCTALVYDMVMVTENLKDFQNINHIQLENWIER